MWRGRQLARWQKEIEANIEHIYKRLRQQECSHTHVDHFVGAIRGEYRCMECAKVLTVDDYERSLIFQLDLLKKIKRETESETEDDS